VSGHVETGVECLSEAWSWRLTHCPCWLGTQTHVHQHDAGTEARSPMLLSGANVLWWVEAYSTQLPSSANLMSALPVV
jgi:hypothetical protein